MGSSLLFNDPATSQGGGTVHNVTAEDDGDEITAWNDRSEPGGGEGEVLEKAGGEPGGPGVGGDNGESPEDSGAVEISSNPRWKAWETSPGHVA